MSEREGTGQRRMRIHRGAHAAWVACVSDGSMSEDVRRTIDAVSEWPTATRGHVGRHTKNMAHLMGCSLAYALAESGKGGRKSAPIDEWRKSSGLGKPAEQLLRTLCAMGQMSRVKKRDPRTDSPRKVWHYGLFDATAYYDKIKRKNWPTRGGVTVSRDELQRYGGAWDVAERHSVDMGDHAIITSAKHGRGCGPRFIDPMTLAVGIACGRYVVNDDGTVSMAITGWGATTAPVGELDGEPVYDTGRTDDATGLPLLDVERPADPHSAQAAFRAMGEAIDGSTRAMSGAADAMAGATTWTKDDNFPLCDTDPVEVHRFVVLVYDHEEAGREECRRRIDDRCHIDHVLQSVSGEGQTIIAEWHDRHPLNLTTTNGDAWFQAEYAKQGGAMPPDVEAIIMTPSPIVTMHNGAALCGSVEQGREVDALRSCVARLEAERDDLAQQRNEWRHGIDASITGPNGLTTTSGMAHDDALRVSREAIEWMRDQRDAWRTALLTAADGELPEVLRGPEAHGEALREYIDGLWVWRQAGLDCALYLGEPGIGPVKLPELARKAAHFAREAHEARESLQTAMYQNSPLPSAVRQRVDTLLARIQELAAERDAAQLLQYTPGELRAIRDALDVSVEGVLEDAGMWKADKLNHIERVAHHAAALARTLRALNPA